MYRSLGPDSKCFLDVRPVGSYFGLYLSTVLVALLDKCVCEVLQKLTRGRYLRLQGTISAEQWNSSIKESQKQQSDSIIMSIDITVYGIMANISTVGDVLCDLDITLQRPNFDLNGLKYVNPHYFVLSHSSEVDLIQENGQFATLTAESQEEFEGGNEQTKVSTSAKVDSILNSLTHQKILRERVADRKIKSMLLPHQKVAIDYILRRESGQLPSKLSLWRSGEDDEGIKLYHHVITGSKRRDPAESRGGIIADEMGLGKSLVVLSALAGSIESASLFLHNDLQREDASTNFKSLRRSSATLVVVPSSLLTDNWIDEIRKHTHTGSLTFFKHHGNKRKNYARGLFESHVVFTTYATVASEASKEDGQINNIFGIALLLICVHNSAHDIRNHLTKQFQSMNRLAAKYRWCLTGTPIQNSLEDLGSLVTFLKVPELEELPVFRRVVSNKCNAASESSFEPLRTLLESICLRRTRQTINIPDPVQQIRTVDLTNNERQQYASIIEQSSKLIQLAVSKRGSRKLNTAVLQSILRLRLFCNNGMTSLQKSYATGLPIDPDEALSYLQSQDEAYCVYCSGNIYTLEGSRSTDGGLIVDGCTHLVCRGCFPQHHSNKRRCPQCCPRGTKGDKAGPHTCATVDVAGDAGKFRPDYPSKLLSFLNDVKEDTRGLARHKR
ncbi:SNF2-related protein [Colletotrichum asianum]